MKVEFRKYNRSTAETNGAGKEKAGYADEKGKDEAEESGQPQEDCGGCKL